MLRFVPDSWLEVLLRPLLLADPVAGLYAEIHAPDWRFLLLVLLLPIAALGRRGRALLDASQWRAIIGLAICFYIWTVVSGNGRYFFWGLLLIGPLVVVVVRRLPATRSMRNTVVLGAVALQATVAWMTYGPNVWALRAWGPGPGLARSAGELGSRPAVFLTVDLISHSVLVPVLHPDSRWANISGQQDLRPGMREFDALGRLLASPLPKYGVIRAARSVMTDDRQPTPAAWIAIRRAFARQSLAPAPKPCVFLQSMLGGYGFDEDMQDQRERGFWFCELVRAAPVIADPAKGSSRASDFDDVFEQVEQRCPRYFPAGNAWSQPSADGVARNYSQSDTSLFINHAGIVYFQNLRAVDPTSLGRAEDVRAGRFDLDCRRLPGRYVPPWSRGWGVHLE